MKIGPQSARPCPAADERFWANVDKDGHGNCWLWTGYARNGYGRLGRGGHLYGAHRIAYVDAYGEPEPGLVIDHLCRVKNCVNPSHLEAVLQRENILRGDTISAANSLAESCPQHHPYTPENTYLRGGSRVCRTCKRLRNSGEKRRARERKRLGLGPGRPGRPKKSAIQVVSAKEGV